jgi:hypothetical protein
LALTSALSGRLTVGAKRKTKLALETYKRISSDLQVPQSFIVPDGHIAWPEELWGMKLGRIVSQIRN